MKKEMLWTVIILTVSVISSLAQSAAEQSLKGANDRFKDIKNRSNELERMRKEADTPTRTPITPLREIKFPEVKEDFEQIQLINTDALQPNAAKSNPSFELVNKAASEIRKRALRLQSNMFAPDAKKKPKKKADGTAGAEPSGDLPALANELETAIAVFIKSPIFQNILVVNAVDSARAQLELEKIIKLSALIENRSVKPKSK